MEVDPSAATSTSVSSSGLAVNVAVEVTPEILVAVVSVRPTPSRVAS